MSSIMLWMLFLLVIWWLYELYVLFTKPLVTKHKSDYLDKLY